MKGNVYKTVLRSALRSGLEMVLVTKRQEAELELAELKMCDHNGQD